MEKNPQIAPNPKPIEPGIFGPTQPVQASQPPANLAKQKADEHKSKRGRKPMPRDESGNIIRPKTTGNGNIVNPQTQAAGQPMVAPTIDPAIISESVKAILSAIDGTVQESVLQTGIKITNQENLAKGLVKQVAMQSQEQDMMAKLSAQVCLQYNMAGQHAPAAFLGVFAVGYATRVMFVLRQLKRLEAVADKKRNESTEHRPQTD